MTIVEKTTRPVVIGGVDTHGDFHVAAAVDANGGVLAGVRVRKPATAQPVTGGRFSSSLVLVRGCS